MDFILHIAQDLPKLRRLQQCAMCLVLGSGGRSTFSSNRLSSRFPGELAQATRDIKSATWTLKGFAHRLRAEHSFKHNMPNPELKTAGYAARNRKREIRRHFQDCCWNTSSVRSKLGHCEVQVRFMQPWLTCSIPCLRGHVRLQPRS